MKLLSMLGATVAAAAFAASAQATVTTFAAYNPIGTAANLYWKNDGVFAGSGTGGSFYTIATGTSTTPGSRNVRFSFLQAGIAPWVTNVTANFTMFASVVNSPAVATATDVTQNLTSGSFSFLSTTPILVGSHLYAAGSNLLSGVFTLSTINGKLGGSSGSESSSTLGGSSITYTSDFLNFTPTVNRDFAIGLTSIRLPFARAPGRALRTFSANSTGSFSSDPAPLLNVPEPATWAMLVMGFGLVGVAARRRKSVIAA